MNGTFTPTASAASLSKAEHFQQHVSALARYSSGTGIPTIPDNDANANPRGFAVRFQLSAQGGHRRHTDIIAHGVPAFPTRTGPEFAAFFAAAGAAQAGDAGPIQEFLGAHPAAKAFVEMPKPFPRSFAEEHFFAVNAFRLVSAEGKVTNVRYSWEPVDGVHHLSEEEGKGKSATYLYDGLRERLGKKPVEYRLVAQVAKEGDATDDSTKAWPEDREKVTLGTLSLDKAVVPEHQGEEQKQIIFDPVPRVEGVEPSDDPMLDYRASLYLMSGRERRAAK